MLKVFVSREGDPLEIDMAKSSGFDILDKTAVDAVGKWLSFRQVKEISLLKNGCLYQFHFICTSKADICMHRLLIPNNSTHIGITHIYLPRTNLL